MVEETQDDPMEIEPVAKKGSKKTVANKSSKSGKKGKTVVEDEEEEEDKLSSREKRLMEKLELVRCTVRLSSLHGCTDAT